MNTCKRWIAAALSLALTASLSISGSLALAPAEPFADFRIDAIDLDVPDRSIRIATYRRDESGALVYQEARDYDCKVNRVTGDATFYIQPKAEGVQATVDYLTNVTGDDFYELTEDESQPAWDSLSAQGELVSGGSEALAVGQTYILSAETLSARFEETARARNQELADANSSLSFPLCRVTLSRTDPAGGQTYEQLYYLELFDDILLPSDVLRSAWWYDAAVYCISRGWLTGRAEDGLFAPEEPLTRAQLAQVLWTMAGCPEAGASDFSDVPSDAWFCQAVSWCRQEGLIAGYEDGTFLPDASLTREQMVSFLHRYAKLSGPDRFNPFHVVDLSQYDDGSSVSSWAADSMRWAVEHRLLRITDNALLPGAVVTRSELAGALYAVQDTQSYLRMR